MDRQGMSGYCLKRTGLPATHSNVPDILSLKDGVTSFGRLTANDHFLDSSVLNCMISRRHAEIRKLEDSEDGCEFEIIDHSLNGTYINDKRADGRQKLHLGDEIKFGHMNGVNIKPGQHAPQPTTEFCFQFSRMPKDELHIPTTNGTTKSVKQSMDKDNIDVNKKYKHGSSSSSGDSDSPIIEKQCYGTKLSGKKRKSRTPSSSSAEDIGSDEDSNSNYSELKTTCNFENDSVIEEAKHAVERFQDSSGSEDIFDTDYNTSKTDPSHNLQVSSYLNNKKGRTQSKPDKPSRKKRGSLGSSSSGWQSKEEKSKPKLKEEKPNSKKTRTTGGGDEWWYYHSDNDKCVAPHCHRPGESDVIDWIACDDCDQWWHAPCAGVTKQQIKKKSFQYHCGCASKKKKK